jgi:hypothetical protein
MNVMEDVKTRSDVEPSYEGDFFAWSQDQGRRLRETRPNSIDWENVAEEIECLGRSQKRSIESDLNVVLLDLLKWQYQANGRNNSLRKSIVEHRRRVAREIKDSPSLRHYPLEVLAEEYETARLGASGETGLPETVFPKLCPYSIEEILDPDYWPDPPQE